MYEKLKTLALQNFKIDDVEARLVVNTIINCYDIDELCDDDLIQLIDENL